jgi:hypothetical protein
MRGRPTKSNSRRSRRSGGATFDRAAKMLSVQPGDCLSHLRKIPFLFSLEILLCATEIAANNGKRAEFCIPNEIALLHGGQRTNDHMPAVFRA